MPVSQFQSRGLGEFGRVAAPARVAIALEIDPNAPPPADDYADPQYQVPDDLIW